MIMNVYYDDPYDCDLIDISISSNQNVEKLQQLFFEWLFNENNDHEDWIVENGAKKGCDYDANAFVQWINQFCLGDKAQMIAQHLPMNNKYPTIFF